MKKGGADLFLFLEDDDAVLMENVVALVRGEGETAILMTDDTVRATGFTPRALARRSERFRSGAVKWKERHR
jgi:hypothetical protein